MGSTRDTLTRVLRKTVKWGGAGLTAVLLVVWIGSARVVGYLRLNSDRGYLVSNGAFEICVLREGRYLHTPEWEFYRPSNSALRWWFRLPNQRWNTDTVIPLWPAALLSLLATAAAWRADAKYLRRVREGACAGCGYDRAGLAAGAVCPECGKQPEAR